MTMDKCHGDEMVDGSGDVTVDCTEAQNITHCMYELIQPNWDASLVSSPRL